MEQGNTPIRGLDSTAPGICSQGLYVKLQNKNWTNFKMQPNKTHIYNHYLFRETVLLENSPNSACFWTEEGNQKPTQTLGEHSNSIQKHHHLHRQELQAHPWHPSTKKTTYTVLPTSGFGTKARPGMVKQLWTWQRYWAMTDRRLLCLLLVLADSRWSDRTN